MRRREIERQGSATDRKENEMTEKEAILKRHSVRQYLNKAIPQEIAEELAKETVECNRESGLNIQFFSDEPLGFSGMLAKYGKFKNVTAYFALVGKNGENLQELCGYYGERLVLKAQALGLNTCWAALTYNKSKCRAQIGDGKKLVCVIAVGYGATQGVPHKSKNMYSLCPDYDAAPGWFRAGADAAILAPTAINQQKYLLRYDGGEVVFKTKRGPYSRVDAGIIKYHFEVGADRKNFFDLSIIGVSAEPAGIMQ